MAATAEAGTRSISACFRRGALSLRANATLVLLAILQSLCFAVAVAISLLPPVLVLGGLAMLPRAETGTAGPAEIEAWISEVMARAGENLLPLGLALLGSILLGMLAVAVWAWFQGGIVGVMVAAERQALPDAHRRSGGWRWFRTFTLRDFAGWGGRYLGRFFWWFHLVVLVSLALGLVAVLLAAGVGAAYQAWGGGAAVGLGCGGAVPLAFLVLLFAAWALVAQPAVALEGSGAVRGSVIGFRVVGHRLGAAIALVMAVVVLSVLLVAAVWVVQVGLSLVTSLFGDSGGIVFLAFYFLVGVFQMLASAAVNLFGLTTGTALVAAEAGSTAR